ncbi:MAG: alpha-L-fucosidase [Capsulimonadaceae bacterium]|nr:alpha-L-fucosidase [Capsulimonadaceae bacterium]
MQPFNDLRDWFVQKQFGLFIHWGLYAIPGWHEQHQMRARAPYDEYVKLAEQWNPVRFNPNSWLDLMEEAGMQYLCLTTKHHDGFCLWDSAQTTYNTMNTPYGKDVLREVADACHKRNIPLCLYYSCVDWHQPNYPNQGRHHELPGPVPGGVPDHARYMEFVREQVRELCTNYGEISGFWWDMNVEQHVDSSINGLIRSLQPSAVINDRGYDGGDFGTPERDFDENPLNGAASGKRLEACQSVSTESWGYRRDESYYADRHLLRGIDRFLANGANYLLNVGPRPDGTIPEDSAAILRRIGQWYRTVREAVFDVSPASQLTATKEVLLTRRGNTVYVHLLHDPIADSVKLGPIASLPRSATLLNTGEPVRFTVDVPPSEWHANVPSLRLQGLPVNELGNTVMVVRLEFDDLPDAVATPAADATNIHVR